MNSNVVFEPALSSPKLDNHEDVVYTNAIQNGNKNDDLSYTPISGTWSFLGVWTKRRLICPVFLSPPIPDFSLPRQIAAPFAILLEPLGGALLLTEVSVLRSQNNM